MPKDVAHKGTSKLKNAFHRTLKSSPAPSAQPSQSPTTDTSATAPAKLGSDRDINPYLKSTHTLPDPDWQAWKIDNKSISELREWGASHGDSNWRKLADKIHAALESKTLEAVQDFIPDSPFPAKTLVKALLSIVQLGINVPVIQKKVYDFAQEAIEYIRTLIGIVGEGASVQKDLEAICTAVNEICEWASEHVRKMTVSAGDLGDWSSKFEKAKEMFLTTTVLQIKVAADNDRRMEFIEKQLANHVATKHKFTDQSKSLCAPGTRVEIREKILEWQSPQASSSEHIFWITGIAGSGKSTLSATVVDNLGTQVAAQFFISRNIPETIDPNKIIPTIAKQLSEFSPAATRVIYDRLKKKGFPSSREEQVKELLLAPIQELSKSCDVVIVLIDALDELQDAARSVLQMLIPIAPKGCKLPDNIKFVITSRPEHWANISNSKTLELAVFKQHPLMTASSVDEVHKFIIAKMKEIKPEDWADWPAPGELAKLSKRADGLFHYAATALQWIQEQIDKHKGACKPWVFEKFAELGIGQLEDLYKLILTSFENIDVPAQGLDVMLREPRLQRFRHVIGTILVLHKPLTIHQIMGLLADIPEGELDVEHFLQQFRSVLIPGTTASFEEATPQIHKSFHDYITSGHAPDEFRISIGHAHFVTARSCMEVIIRAGSKPDLGQQDAVQQYSVQNWYRHLRKAVEEGATWEDEGIHNMFGQMIEEAVVDIWKASSWWVFLDVAAAGWGLLKVGSKYGGESQVNNDFPASSQGTQGGENFNHIKNSTSAWWDGNGIPTILIEIPLVPRK
ncbi:hypothetical protein MVEN_00864200 [Mycena venus]|uniref:NACHT domain-containing protein n=1 Tax=Mycena venus TaxID=2733690 RepID=A0A8H6YH46_9AGAR|nr:hypothetical protein MVEN_00864200 [Mycena venus]